MAESLFLLHKVMLLLVTFREDYPLAGVKTGGCQGEVLDLLYWQWFVTRPAELCAFFSPHVWGGAHGLLDMHLDHSEKGQITPDISGHGGGECELFLSQPTPLTSVWMRPALTTALLCWALQGCFPKQYLSVLQLFLCKM